MSFLHIKDSMSNKSSAVSSEDLLCDFIHVLVFSVRVCSLISPGGRADAPSSPETRSCGPRAPHQSGLLHRLLLIRLSPCFILQKILIHNHRTPLCSNLECLLWKTVLLIKHLKFTKCFMLSLQQWFWPTYMFSNVCGSLVHLVHDTLVLFFVVICTVCHVTTWLTLKY